ncbi:histidine phosphatase family protein [Brevibacillus borstelensis]|jgi:2,3-bisphosphoglycerate-dependent phosphoglycerate mutase|uniref:histidine phosphatase family protein n=1 Tax=Brevibacillus borstelensis TaxID=45462 RepID=UPI000F07A38B|nr:histidine phosphatase family protein [Brevibacillus borstelensis]MED1882997.1 histidine phosphatase family protein [Brevibacillus borstelensis]RNB65907.1 histidine phosphatase family protein [Brevibacillus borstelensis]GED53146.1 phosphoglycerate mutase [Brevibacillus borstelensis]
MRTNIFFVRHAHSDYTPEERTRPLSEKGLRDAQAVSELLKKENIHHVLSSPYRRAIQTVEGIAVSLEKEIVIEEDFKERVLSEKPVEDFHAAITRVWEDEGFSWDGGESNKAAQDRGVKAIKRVLRRLKGKNIVIGTHGNLMVLIMNGFDSRYGFDFWKQLDMPDIYKLSFDGSELKEVTRLWRHKDSVDIWNSL